MPVLLQERDQEVDAHHDVGDDLVFRHANVADSDRETEHLLQLEFDGGTDFVGLFRDVIRVRDGRGEFADLGETRTQETRNLLDQGFRGEESIVLLGYIQKA